MCVFIGLCGESQECMYDSRISNKSYPIIFPLHKCRCGCGVHLAPSNNREGRTNVRKQCHILADGYTQLSVIIAFLAFPLLSSFVLLDLSQCVWWLWYTDPRDNPPIHFVDRAPLTHSPFPTTLTTLFALHTFSHQH